jgi:alginate O-acetyltransferase complex protein AlgI
LVTSANFALGRRVRRDGLGRRGWLWIAIAFNIVALAGFRLANFYVTDLQELLTDSGLAFLGNGLEFLVPIGLSYYILENISYQVDAYRGQVEVERSWLEFALYQAYFPKLLSGPIERARTFLPKLREQRIVDNDKLARGFSLIVIGLTRKLLFADNLRGAMPGDLFDKPGDFSPPELLAWLVVFAFTLYNDFAGYTNIVRGVSLFFGIELSPNFDRPYFARNLTEFWNRWHISLSHWLRDYIYFPLSRTLLRRNPSRRNAANLILPPLVTMVASGLWHGFSGHMLLWGGLHGVYQIVERLPSLWRPMTAPQQRPWWRQGLNMGVVFALVILAWVPFQAEVPAAFNFWQALLDWSNIALRFRRLPLMLIYLLPMVAFDWLQYRAEDELVVLRWPSLVQAGLLAIAVFLLLIVSQASSGEPFVYQGF